MELEKQTKEFKQFFLLAFTKELIINSIKDEFVRLKIDEEIEEELRKEIPKQKAKEMILKSKYPPLPRQTLKMSTFAPALAPRKLIIPKQNFPERLQYIRPIPTRKQLDLKKLNPFLMDRAVQSIECNGPDENIIINTPGKRTTNIKLSEEEIKEIMQIFSEVTRIPIAEGVFRVAYGNLILSAIVSEIIGTKFIIKKMGYPISPTGN